MKKLVPFIIIFELVIINLVFIYFILVNTVLSGTPLPNLKSKNLKLDDIYSAGYQELKGYIPENIKVNFEGNIVDVPLSEIDIKVDKGDLVQYGKGSDIIKVLASGIKLLDGEYIDLQYSFNTEKFFKYLPKKLNSIYPSTIGEDNKLNCTGEYNIKIDNFELNRQFNSAIYNKEQLTIDADVFSEYKDYEVYKICEEYLSKLDIISKKLEFLGDEFLEIYMQLFQGFKSSNLIISFKDKDKFLELLRNYKTKSDIKLNEGNFEERGNKIVLFSNYTVGKELDLNTTLNSIETWVNNPSSELELVYKYSNPYILTSGKEILDFTKLAAVGTTRIDLIRNGVENFVVPYTEYGLIEIQDHIIMPGEEFSYLNHIKPQPDGRTLRGYPIAGGFCNSTTTLFRAVLEGGFEITERNYHAVNVASYSWGYQYNIVDAAYYTNPKVDFKFKNDSNYPIMLKISFDRSKNDGYQYNSVSIYTNSQAPKRSVELKNWKLWDINSATSFKGSFDRIVYEDGKIIRTDNFYSHYI